MIKGKQKDQYDIHYTQGVGNDAFFIVVGVPRKPNHTAQRDVVYSSWPNHRKLR